ncbi:MAG: oligosaccharide flippase family protein [Candidatus Methylumidiphilus sp.]
MSLKKNILANYLGQGWMALMEIAFVPVYIKYLGMEAYGLIGLFVMLQAWLGLLDMGMNPTLNREMARYTAGEHTAQSIRDLLRSLEVIAFTIGLLIVLVVWLSATWLSTYWLKVERMPLETVSQAISAMGFVLALRFIETLYHGAIVGLQQQVLLNLARASTATLRSLGAVAILIWVKPSIELFFVWQSIVSVLTIIVFIIVTYRHLPSLSQPSKFCMSQLERVWRFASGMMATTLLVLLLMQVDKIILSRVLSLEMFGYYTLAGTVAQSLALLITPVTQAYYPRFTELATQGDIAGLIALHHQSAQLICVLVVPVALMLMFFGENILQLWTGNAVLAQDVAPILALLTLGTLLNGFMHIPYLLTLAYGWSSFGVQQNIVAVILFIPAILWIAPRYGALGAASMWVILNFCCLLISPHYIYSRYLKTEKWCWYINDVIYPTIPSLSMAILFWQIQPILINKLMQFAWLVAIGLVIFSASGLSVPIFRNRRIRIFSC